MMRPMVRPRRLCSSSSPEIVKTCFGASGSDQLSMISIDIGVFIGKNLFNHKECAFAIIYAIQRLTLVENPEPKSSPCPSALDKAFRTQSST